MIETFDDCEIDSGTEYASDGTVTVFAIAWKPSLAEWSMGRPGAERIANQDPFTRAQVAAMGDKAGIALRQAVSCQRDFIEKKARGGKADGGCGATTVTGCYGGD